MCSFERGRKRKRKAAERVFPILLSAAGWTHSVRSFEHGWERKARVHVAHVGLLILFCHLPLNIMEEAESEPHSLSCHVEVTPHNIFDEEEVKAFVFSLLSHVGDRRQTNQGIQLCQEKAVSHWADIPEQKEELLHKLGVEVAATGELEEEEEAVRPSTFTQLAENLHRRHGPVPLK
ncbi:hypothetical protein NDU88_004514 [Pleurodeles waltl]|uniref:Uncharacterized protein n=1 Tax=Pleurodeles waltl TaxID=8319 RepID=A0AAV7W833_PLEWA|nr:hypothetical protein NDU88_004514 [Pleurodeles waltl]